MQRSRNAIQTNLHIVNTGKQSTCHKLQAHTHPCTLITIQTNTHTHTHSHDEHADDIKQIVCGWPDSQLASRRRLSVGG